MTNRYGMLYFRMNKIHRIVLTGGPGAGKTTALAHLQEKLLGLGFKVFMVPEAATILLNGGLRVMRSSFNEHVYFQSSLLRLQLMLEDTFYETAKREAGGQPCVIICDRGTMDGKGFANDAEWEAVMDIVGSNITKLRDRRYDAVIHLESAAVNVPAYYTQANNKARQENVAEASMFDARVLKAWVGHPHLKIIKSRENFEDKINELMKVVGIVVGVPMSVEIERKYLVYLWDVHLTPEHAEKSIIKQDYLLTDDPSAEERVRKRVQDGTAVYTHTIKRPYKDGQRIEEERIIDVMEYNTLLKKKDPALNSIEKQRLCFLWEGQYFEFDIYLSGNPCNLMILEVELDDPEKEVTLPPCMKNTVDVTNDKKYSNYELAKLKEPMFPSNGMDY